jgi:hypothetical protein
MLRDVKLELWCISCARKYMLAVALVEIFVVFFACNPLVYGCLGHDWRA